MCGNVRVVEFYNLRNFGENKSVKQMSLLAGLYFFSKHIFMLNFGFNKKPNLTGGNKWGRSNSLKACNRHNGNVLLVSGP